MLLFCNGLILNKKGISIININEISQVVATNPNDKKFKDDENYKILLNFIATMFIMKDCNYVITGSGNCCLWLALLRSTTFGYVNFFQYKNARETPVDVYERELNTDYL